MIFFESCDCILFVDISLKVLYYLDNTETQEVTMDFNKDQPIYIQLVDLIKMDIISGKMKASDKLPSIREFAEETMVNPNTVQKAYTELELRGYIFSKRGIGYFVNEDQEFIDNLKGSFLENRIDEFIKDMSNLDYSKETIINKIKERL